MTDIIIFAAYAFLVTIARYMGGFRELHMLQQNSYQFKSHFNRAIQKGFISYIPYVILLLFFLINNTLLCISSDILGALFLIVAPVIVIIINRPKKFKKPFVYTARVKRMIVTFTIITLIPLAVAVISFLKGRFGTAFITLTVILCLTPLAALLSNLINYPIEEYIRRWYINDAKKILSGMKSLDIVGITGSYGKTSMKFYLGELLNSQYNTLITPESYNTPMGVVKTIRMMMKSTHEIFVCEMGARHVGDIKELCDIVHPHDAIITSIGPQHLETFGKIENIISTKFELGDAVNGKGKILVNGDDENIRKGMGKYENVITYGFSDNNDYKAKDISVS